MLENATEKYQTRSISPVEGCDPKERTQLAATATTIGAFLYNEAQELEEMTPEFEEKVDAYLEPLRDSPSYGNAEISLKGP